MALQQSVGNRAVQAMLARADDVGWKGPDIDPSSANADETLVPSDGGRPGVRRIPVQGIQAGHPAGRPARKDDRRAKKDEKQAHTVTDPAGESTTEAADTSDGGRAIVLVPKRLLDTTKIEVLFHLHGHTIGYRQPREDAKPPPDEDVYRIEQQLDASARPMIAVLPQGDIKSLFWRGGVEAGKGKAAEPPPVFNVDDYIREAVGKVPQRDWPNGKRPDGWSVVLSGHSGAGAGLAALFGSESHLPKHLTGLVEFDAVNQKPGGKVSEIGGGAEYEALKGFLMRRLEDDLTKIKGVTASAGATPAAEITKRQVSTLENEGFQFRAVFHGDPHFANRAKTALSDDVEAGYADRYWKLEREVLDWLARHKKDVGVKGDAVYEALLKNYTFQGAGEGVDHMAMIGKNLESVLRSLRARP